jgi:hypothetical protein
MLRLQRKAITVPVGILEKYVRTYRKRGLLGIKKRRGRILFRDPAPSFRFLKTRFGHRITRLSSRNPSSPANSRFSQSSVPTFLARASCLRHSSPSSFLEASRVSLPILLGAGVHSLPGRLLFR